MITKVLQVWDDLTHLVYPNECLVCEVELSKSESHLCFFCKDDLSLTNFQHFDEPTEMDKMFWGRFEVNKTYAHVFFQKENASQSILFNLKYKNNHAIGAYFGREIGAALKMQSEFSTVDVCIPIPLHPKKEFIRGYNQSELLAKGICDVLNIKLDNDVVKRIKHSDTQTKKSRFQRWDNVNEIFKVKARIRTYKHVLIVDDVVTTGSTLEAVAAKLMEVNPKLTISIATLAIA